MPPIQSELLDELLKDYQKPDDLLGQDGLLQQLTKALVERALDSELTHHLGYEKHDASGDNSGNSRNGTSPKTIKGKRGQVRIDVPRDRASEFEPQIVKKGQIGLPRPLSGRFAGEGQEPGPRHEQGDLPGLRRQPPRAEGSLGHVGIRERRREVLDADRDGVEEPGHL
jgi:hypothetical protein